MYLQSASVHLWVIVNDNKFVQLYPNTSTYFDNEETERQKQALLHLQQIAKSTDYSKNGIFDR